MFKKLGHWTAHHRRIIILMWITLAVALPLTAPSLDDVSTSDQRDFLPTDAPFAKAEHLYQDLFPENFSPSSGMIVIDSGTSDGFQPGTEAWTFADSLTTWLASTESPDNILEVNSPTQDPTLAERLIDADSRYALVAFGLSTPSMSQETRDTIATLDHWLDEQVPNTLKVYHTGEAKIDIEGDQLMIDTIDQTLVITIILVIVFLLLIYRSPVSPLIPLFSVTVALFVTTGLLGLLADAGVLKVMTMTQPLLIVVMYGAGTDYCLFLISRFREEMSTAGSVEKATQDTVHRVGETITSSASTVFVGFMAMAFSEMGLFKNSGPTLAVGIVVGLLAGLTLTPALLALLGERAFWPSRARHRSSGRWYEFTSRQSSSHPLLTILLIAAIMLPFSAYGLSRDVTYNFLDDYPKDMESLKGYHLLEDHFGNGLLFPVTVVVANDASETQAADITRLTQQIAAIDGVSDVMSLNNPLGLHTDNYQNMLRVETQLQMALGMFANSAQETGASEQTAQIAGGWSAYLAQLAVRFPAWTDAIADLQTILGNDDVADVVAHQDELVALTNALTEQAVQTEDAYLMLSDAGPLFEPFAPMQASYLSPDGGAFQMNVLLTQGPGDEQSFHAVEQIRQILKQYGDKNQVGVSGFAAILFDIRETVDADLIRAFAFVLIGIFLVLLVMLRSIVAPLYLICTVLLSYTFSLGITNLVFKVFFGTEHLMWAVEFFMFVFLVALGIDYSIFLFGRIKEEVANHGPREGVHIAVATTGMIITSAGLILAGTFGGLIAGEIKFLAQIGFAVAFGVLVDTFVVRTILDPALAALFGRWTWWPGGVPKMRQVRPSTSAASSPASPGDR
jgi:RND superfamily putative drug exporter